METGMEMGTVGINQRSWRTSPTRRLDGSAAALSLRLRRFFKASCAPSPNQGGTKRDKASVTDFPERVRTRSQCELGNRRHAAQTWIAAALRVRLPRFPQSSLIRQRCLRNEGRTQ
jgi:hypothetical protein